MLLGRIGNDIEYFCTVLLMFVRRDGAGLTVDVASAGHPPGLVIDATGSWSEIDVSGPPAGWYHGASYDEATIELSRGDRLIDVHRRSHRGSDGRRDARRRTALPRLVSAASSPRDTIDALLRRSMGTC